MNNHYAVLGVPYTVTAEGIQRAYRRLAKKCHPDHAGGEGAERFHAIHEAYEVLSDVDRRKQYDKVLQAHKSALHPAAEPLVGPGPTRNRPEPLHAQGLKVDQTRPDILLNLIRDEVCQFARVAEMLLSPIRLSPKLTNDEEAFIRLYLEQLIERYGV